MNNLCGSALLKKAFLPSFFACLNCSKISLGRSSEIPFQLVKFHLERLAFRVHKLQSVLQFIDLFFCFVFESLETIHLCPQIANFFVNCFYIPFQILNTCSSFDITSPAIFNIDNTSSDSQTSKSESEALCLNFLPSRERLSSVEDAEDLFLNLRLTVSAIQHEAEAGIRQLARLLLHLREKSSTESSGMEHSMKPEHF